eukprot:6226852-Pyramimonas_sp.AAC.1
MLESARSNRCRRIRLVEFGGSAFLALQGDLFDYRCLCFHAFFPVPENPPLGVASRLSRPSRAPPFKGPLDVAQDSPATIWNGAVS